MRAHLWLGVFLLLAAGCQKANPTVSKPPQSNPVGQAQPQSNGREDSATKPAANGTPPAVSHTDLAAKREADLLARLAASPDDADVLLKLATLTQTHAAKANLTGGDAQYGLFKKSGEYLHRALEADANVTKLPGFKVYAPVILYNEACALSHEKQDEACLKSLTLAVEHGWTDLGQMMRDPDLEHVRQNAGFAAIEEIARESQRKAMSASIDALFASTKSFSFDFDLTDTEGQPVTKQEFAGKLLMVNIWGTWCPPCRKEIPDLIAAYDKYKSQGFEIVGINTENQKGDAAVALIKKSQQQFGINYRCALSDAKTLQQVPDMDGVPTSIFFNREGQVQAMIVGMINRVQLEMIIERLLKDSPAATTDAAK